MKRPPVRNLIQNDGLTQPGRFLEELDPLFAKIDDRSLTDLISFAWKYSDHLLFYEAVQTVQGEEVRPSGTWQQLLRHEQLFSLALISLCSPVKYSRQFEAALDVLDPEHDSDNEWQSKVYPAFVAVVTLCEEVDDWWGGLPVGSKGYRDLKNYIKRLKNKVEQLLALYRQLIPDGKLWHYVSSHLKTWNINEHGAPSQSGPLMSKEEVVSSLRFLFGEVQTTYSAIINNAKQTFETLLQEDTHQAHIGLFIAFLRLLEDNREHLNKLTGRHLDFYLRKILQLKPKDRQPDAVNLTFELAKKIDRHRLAPATAFKGGKNEDKKERLYDLKNEVTLTKAMVTDLKNIHVIMSGRETVQSVHAGGVANSLDGLGEALAEDNPKWSGFGTSSYPLAELGLVVASPLFRLSEGERAVTMRFLITDLTSLQDVYSEEFDHAARNVKDEVQLPNIFTAKVSTAKGWYDCIPDVFIDRKKSELVLVSEFDMDVPPIVDYNGRKLGDAVPLRARWPLFRFTVDQQGEPGAYDVLRTLRATKLTVEIQVDRVRGLVLGNDAAKLKADKPFLPFGSQPRIGSTFFIGHAESFAKPLTDLSLSWKWVDPPQNLESHYQNYTDDKFQFSADVDLRENYNWDHSLEKNAALSKVVDPVSFKIIAALPLKKLDILNNAINKASPKELRNLQDGTTKFPFAEKIELAPDVLKAVQNRFILGKQNETLDIAAKGRKLPPAIRRQDTNVFAETPATKSETTGKEIKALISPFKQDFNFDVINYDPSYDTEPFSQYTETLRQGGIRLRLKTPTFAFGHKLYPKLHSQAVAAAMRPEKPNPSLLDSLELPYTPMIENLELSYRAKKEFSLAAADANLEMMLLHPFGYTNPGKGELIADYTVKGSLYIGLSALELPNNLSLLIQLAEGSGDPFKTAPQKVLWEYLTNAGWKKFTKAEILREGTLGFLQSGIIEFSLPKTMSSFNPEMPQGHHWLRVTVSDNTAALHDVLAIIAQAGVAVYRDEGHSAKHLATALAAGSVAKLLVRGTSIKTVSQPFASYGGREAESDSEFYSRCSERLRHKDRAVGLWDYEHLVLEHFPEVYKVKCLNHTCPRSNFSPGNVMLVLMPDLQNRNSRYPLRPAVAQSVLEEVKKFVMERCSPHIDIHVVNPFYERIAIGGVAHFHKGYDQGIYQNQLWQDITSGLTPWQRGEKDIHFGGRIHSSVILNLVEKLPYIDYLSKFTVTHYLGRDDTEGKHVDEVTATSNRSILVSNDTHTIQGVTPK